MLTTQLFAHLTDSSVTHLQNALQHLSSWMIANLLTLNSSKTEFLLIGLQQPAPILTSKLPVPLHDTQLLLSFHPPDFDSSVTHLCYKLPKSQTDRLQVIQNFLARAVVKAAKYYHVIPIIRSLC